MKKNHIVALSAAMVLVGLAGCDSNDRNRDYNTRTDRDSVDEHLRNQYRAGRAARYGVPERALGNQ